MQPARIVRTLLLLLPSMSLGPVDWVSADEELAAKASFFRESVWPVIEDRCLQCHGANPEKIRGEFRIDSRAALLAGGTRGPAINEQSPEDSLLLEMISWKDVDHEMPPSKQLPPDEIAVLHEWVLDGATWSQGIGEETSKIATREIPVGGNWWAWQPLERPQPPEVNNESWIRNPIDRFILARLEAADLEPAPPSSRRDLIRRLTYDLIGLPPTPEEVEAFVADDRPEAYDELVDRLLDSPQHGVKWARHWLDAVRFAETDGYERDRNKPAAWRYRDWVVDAVNQDKPWDRFVTEQLAGDELPDRDLDSLVATGYFRLGIWDDEPTDTLLAQYDDLDSIVDVTSRSMLGMSVSCARCHDHKRDPIPQADYYRLAAVFRDIRPYKQGGGNSINAADFVRRVPTVFGNESGLLQDRIDYLTQRTSLIGSLRKLEQYGSSNREPAVAEGLRSEYRFDGDDPTVLHDNVGSRHGTLEVSGNAGKNGTGKSARYGRNRNGLHFDGDAGGRGARIPHEVHDDFTISFWMRTSSLGRGQDSDPRWFQGTGLVDGEISGVVDDLGVSMIGNGIIAAGVGRPETFINSAPGYNDGKWHHVAFTRDASTGLIQLHVDGLKVAEKTGGRQSLDDPKHLAVGRMYPGHGAFNGDLDDLRIHDRPLTSREIAGLATGLRLDDRTAELIAFRKSEDAANQYRAAIDQLVDLKLPDPEMVDVLCAISLNQRTPETTILTRGNPHLPGRAVRAGVPRVLGGNELDPETTTHEESPGTRLAFANWLFGDANPSTPRVTANRVWQHHFGRGIVRSSDDFGRLGDQPTHPELLDWLACEMTDRNWSMKDMHRLIVKSNAYRMSNAWNNDAFLVDPVNDLLWRNDMRRLSAEELRDSVLAVSGNLNLKMAGPSIYPPMPRAVLETASRPNQAWGRSSPTEAARRSLYVFVKRSLRHPLLEGFDQPDTDRPCSVRFNTTVPTQSLMMINSDFMNKQAKIFADRLKSEHPDDLGAQLTRGLELATSRPPTPEEIAELRGLVQELIEEDRIDEQDALATACLVILNLNEFLHLK